MVADLLKELSNHNERSEERKGALVELLKITRENNLAVWDEHFKTFLLLLLETLGDKDVGVLRSVSVLTDILGVLFALLSAQHTVRALALRVLKEILKNQPARFKNYAELTIMKTLEAHKDSHKEVGGAAGRGLRLLSAASCSLGSVLRWCEQLRRPPPRWPRQSTQSSASRCCAPSCRQPTTPSTWPPLRCRPKSSNASPRSPWCSCCRTSSLDSCR